MTMEPFVSIRIGLASPETMRKWSYGEVKKPETINYRTLRPEKDGLFCEKIFGPTKDWECYCGQYKRVRHKGTVCDRCGVEVTKSKVRRERMGHINLACPVCHIWYFKGVPSRVSVLLDLTSREVEKILYYVSFVITDVDSDGIHSITPKINDAIEREMNELRRDAEKEIEKFSRSQYEAFLQDLQEKLEILPGEDIDLDTLKDKVLMSQVIDPKTGEVIMDVGEKFTVESLSAISTSGADLSNVKVLEQTAKVNKKLSHIQGQVDDFKQRINEELVDRESELRSAVALLSGLKVRQLLSEREFRALARLMDILNRHLHGNYNNLFVAKMGAEAMKDLLKKIDLDELKEQIQLEVMESSGQKRIKLIKRLKVIESFRKSGNRPEWMILDVIPVLPPELRPMVQLEGGRFASSDLNDLYRRVINRNNRLKKLLEIRAPESIIRNEKRMLQEAVDSLIDNGRRGRPVTGSNKRPLKSLSDLLKGKQGRFRQNLLGKRVDYSGRSVIVIGPELSMNQCGLPKEMALELFKPFVMKKLVDRDHVHNIKSAKKMVERAKTEVWDVLDEVVKGHPVLLNRAPTLHRLGIQGFEPILIDGKAIQIHPLVCVAYNADFDGDQMAVHVPLSLAAQAEAKLLMLSTNNLLLPADGSPVVSPTQDIVIGCYYLTMPREGAKGEGKIFASPDEALMAYDQHVIDIHALIRVRLNGELMETTAGKLIFNSVFPPDFPFINEFIDKGKISDLILQVIRRCGQTKTVEVLDKMKEIGFKYATIAGVSISIDDIKTSAKKPKILAETERKVEQFTNAFQEKAERRLPDIERELESLRKQAGSAKRPDIEKRMERLMLEQQSYIDIRKFKKTEYKRLTDKLEVSGIPYEYKIYYDKIVDLWDHCTKSVIDEALKEFDDFNPILMMVKSAARGSLRQVQQMAGMRGLMSDPEGWATKLPVKSNFKEGLTVLEYFISTHGARKGLADTALRTAESGYLTRRLVDVAQDVMITHSDTEDYTDCGNMNGIPIDYILVGDDLKLVCDDNGIFALSDHKDLRSFSHRVLGRFLAKDVKDPNGSLMFKRGRLLMEDEIEELCSRGFKGPLYVRSTLECQNSFGVCVKCYGLNLATRRLAETGEPIGIIAAQSIGEPGTQLTMRTFHTGGVTGQDITQGLPRVEELFEARKPKEQAVITEVEGVVSIEEEPEADARDIVISTDDGGEHRYRIPFGVNLLVDSKMRVSAGDRLTEGPINPHDILRIKGKREVQIYIVREVQSVYKSQGVNTNDKHIEVIVRQMLKKVRIDDPGDTIFLPKELADLSIFHAENAKVTEEGGQPATAEPVLLGITKSSLSTESFLSAASFQETTRVLTEAAVNRKEDPLRGLKENVIIGHLIPVGTGTLQYRDIKILTKNQPESIDSGHGE